MGDQPPQRQINKLLVANRGEIATRILSTARDLGITTYALTTESDTSHSLNATHVLALSSASSYLSPDTLIDLVKQNSIDAVHPGYGFLSESAEFAKRLWEEAGAIFIGPHWEALERTGDKLEAKRLAEECNVPVLPAMQNAVGTVDDVKQFVSQSSGYPVMLKAVDGGGGRGIRLVRDEQSLENSAKRAIEESPSKQVFAEKAAVDGFRHVEIQIIGDGQGNIQHLWERECSIQRRYQKIIELAPSTISNRTFVARIINSAMAMAQKINYYSLGTFEFLANPSTEEFFFLEINPRLQVEHTITESIALTDIVAIQLQLAQGALLPSLLPKLDRVKESNAQKRQEPYDPEIPPPLHSVQLRITAENVHAEFSLSIGKISSFHFPSGNGVRVDTGLVAGHEAVISPDFDSLIAKLIITGPSWESVVNKSRRALQDTYVGGVKTNLDVLRGIVASEAFANGTCDTQWLEANIPALIESGEKIGAQVDTSFFTQTGGAQGQSGGNQGLTSSTVLLRKGDAWSIRLAPNDGKQQKDDAPPHHLKLQRVLRNEFPSTLIAEITYATPDSQDPIPYHMSMTATGATSSSLLAEGKHRRGDPSNPLHVIIPFPGKLVEVLVDEGDEVKDGDVVAVVQQMKMELEVRAKKGGICKWVIEAEDGEDVAEGALAVELEDDGNDGKDSAKPKL